MKSLPCALLLALLTAVAAQNGLSPSTSPSPIIVNPSSLSTSPVNEFTSLSPSNPTPQYPTNNDNEFGSGFRSKEDEVEFILKRMETEVLDFRDELERAYSSRCDTNTLTECTKSNFNDCTSSFYSNQECMKSDELVIAACGDGETCNALWDKTISTVSLPSALAQNPFNNPTDPEIIESACYTRLVEPYMAEQYANDEQFWAQYNVSPSWTYFGAHNGLFRKIPATHQETCGVYDPRKRPWFVAASSGPKDVVLVIDTSGSMNDYNRIAIAKEAAITIVETLTVADRFAVVSFDSTATQLAGEDMLIRATIENKRLLIESIKQLEAGGATNFFDAFNTAFNAISNTIRSESTSGCNIAILFMTDGTITAGESEEAVTALVNYNTRYLSLALGRNTTIFTYSLGQNADHTVTKNIACTTNGIWAKVDDLSGDLVTAMSSYYMRYALGLGEGGNEDFFSWVEPYEFANPAGKVGTTVSVPVYDRSVEPPLFLGVAAIDMYLDAFEQVLGESASSSNMLDRFVRLSTATCPKIELTECELDALRFLGGGSEATCGRCGNNDSSFVGVIPEKCPFVSDLPNNLWDNTDNEGKPYEEKACCEIGGIAASQTCSNNSTTIDLDGGSAVALFIGLAIAGVTFIACCCFCCTKFFKANKKGGTGKIVYQINGSVLGRNGSSTAPAPSMSVPTTTHVQQPPIVQQQFQPTVMAQVVQQPNVVTSVGGSYHATQPQPMYVTTQQPVVTGTVYNPNVTVMSSPSAPPRY